MPGLPVIPEVNADGYESYARQVVKRRRKFIKAPDGASRKSPSRVQFSSDFVPKREVKPDYFGLDNSMKKLTLGKTRKWRTKQSANDRKLAWQTGKEKADRKRTDEEDKASVSSCDRHVLRKSRSFLYTKFKYPEKFHYPSWSQNVQLEENIPQCLRKSPRYSNLPIRQACAYKPVCSVTQLRVHSIRSSCLPHPSPDGTVAKRRRPTSAPPGSMTSPASVTSMLRKDSSPERVSSFRRQSSNDSKSATACQQHVTFDNGSEAAERNGSFEYRYDIEEPTHITLEVQESDDDEASHSSHDERQTEKSYAARESVEGQEMSSDKADKPSAAEEGQSETSYSDDYETESAKSVDCNPDRL